jgi:hypothetical protein
MVHAGPDHDNKQRIHRLVTNVVRVEDFHTNSIYPTLTSMQKPSRKATEPETV